VAVVQISRIQIRRGQKNQGSGLPQLSSGELGWAIDTQELYIGNGSVAEGAPQVGNTKVITEHDDLFTLADEYIYRSGDGSITTGIDAANPVTRTLQERLDDRVSVRAFGITGNEAQDATVLLQRAIDQLFLNSGNELSARNRVALYIEPGIYTVKDTIRIPPHATIIGAGAGKTIIKQTNPGRTVFTTVSDESIPGGYVVGGEYATQARNIRLEGMTLEVVSGSRGLVLESCRDSNFDNIKIIGPWTIGTTIPTDSSATTDIALSLNSKNGGVETARNEFNRCEITGFAYGIVSNWDINDNVFNFCTFEQLGYGVSFGKNMTLDGIVANGTAYGPRNNAFNECVFKDTQYEAMLVSEGSYNKSCGNKFITCGNNGGSDDMPFTPVIRFSKLGNNSVGDYFTRTRILSYTQGVIKTGSATLVAGGVTVTVASTEEYRPGQIIIKISGTGEFGASARILSVNSPTQFTVDVPHLANGAVSFELTSPVIEDVVYVPEVEGPCNFEWGFEHEVTILDGDNNTLFRLPKLATQSFDIDYLAVSEQGYNAVRSGKLRIVVNSIVDAPNGTPSLTVTDDYDYVGDDLYLDTISFDAILSDVDADTNFDTIVVKTFAAGLPTTARTKFKFKVQTKQNVL
jgi:hypothetical protein